MHGKFLFVLIAIAISVDPTKASPARIKRQGWVWDDVATLRPPIVSTTRPTTSIGTVTPIPSTTSATTIPNGLTTVSPTIALCISRCRTTQEYNPVCGTNRQTYDNPNKLKCAVNCGVGVQINFMGACSPL